MSRTVCQSCNIAFSLKLFRLTDWQQFLALIRSSWETLFRAIAYQSVFLPFWRYDPTIAKNMFPLIDAAV